MLTMCAGCGRSYWIGQMFGISGKRTRFESRPLPFGQYSHAGTLAQSGRICTQYNSGRLYTHTRWATRTPYTLPSPKHAQRTQTSSDHACTPNKAHPTNIHMPAYKYVFPVDNWIRKSRAHLVLTSIRYTAGRRSALLKSTLPDLCRGQISFALIRVGRVCVVCVSSSFLHCCVGFGCANLKSHCWWPDDGAEYRKKTAPRMPNDD